MHSNSSNSDSTSQQPVRSFDEQSFVKLDIVVFQSVTQEIKNLEEIEDLQPIVTVEVENNNDENVVESNPLIVSEETQPTSSQPSTVPTNKSWWSSLVRLFHFGHSTADSKPQIDSESSTLMNENYLSNVKARRSLHNSPIVG